MGLKQTLIVTFALSRIHIIIQSLFSVVVVGFVIFILCFPILSFLIPSSPLN